MTKKLWIMLVVVALNLFIVAAGFAQSTGSSLLRAKTAELIIQGEIVGKSDVSYLCGDALPCQVIALRVKEVLKGEYKSRNIKILFTLNGSEQYVEKNSTYFGLSRYFFEQGKNWIVMIHNTNAGKCSLFTYPSNSSNEYSDIICMQGSLASIIPGDPEEILVMQEFVRSMDRSRPK